MSNEPDKIIYSMIRVSKRHGQKEVLKDISLSYFYGAKIGVLGLNAAGDEGQHVGGRPARGRAHQDHAHGQFRRQGEHMAQTEGQQRHAAELHHQAQPQVTGVPQHMAEVLPVQGHAHAQHDDAQHGGNMRRHPGKDPGLPQG